jgi:high-affinity Fe2+/Pb2+ permease
MSKVSRHHVNAVVCLLALGYAIYWFGTGRVETASTLRIGLMALLAVLGVGGALWFFRRARDASR